MKRVALVTYKTEPKLTPSDALLVAPLKKEGIHAVAAAWDDPTIHWKQFDGIVFRSCWNYYARYEKFLLWLEQCKSMRVRVWNPVDLVMENSQKTYLRALQNKGIPIVPTIWRKKGAYSTIKNIMTETGSADIVIKPTIGARSYEVFRVKSPSDIGALWKLHRLIKHKDVMIQPFIAEIATEGEYSFIFIGNTYSHAVCKLPSGGEFRSNYHGSNISLFQPKQPLIHQASQVIEALHADTLYGRVDAINQNGRLILMEVELIEPMLFFDLYPPAATTFAKALKKRLQ